MLLIPIVELYICNFIHYNISCLNTYFTTKFTLKIFAVICRVIGILFGSNADMKLSDSD